MKWTQFFTKSTKIGVFYKMDPVFSRDGYPEIRTFRDPWLYVYKIS